MKEQYKRIKHLIKKTNLTDSLQVIHAYDLHYSGFAEQGSFFPQVPNSFFRANKGDLGKKFGIYPARLHLLLSEVIKHSSKGEGPGKKSFSDWNFFQKILDEFNNLYGVFYKTFISEENKNIELHRTTQNQLVWQGNQYSRAIRYWKLFSYPEFSEAIKDIYNIPGSYYHLMGFSVFSVCRTALSFNYPPSIEIKQFNLDHLNTFLQHFSRTFTELKIQTEDNHLLDQHYFYQLQPISKFPLIMNPNLGQMKILCPMPSLFLRQYIDGLYYELIKKAKFSQILGDSLEQYTKLAAEKAAPTISRIPEQIYGSPEKKTSDLICYDDSGVLFIECKSKRITLESKLALDIHSIEPDLRTLADALCQIYKVIDDYISGEIINKFGDSQNFYPILMTLENWNLFIPEIKSEILRLLQENLKKSGLSQNMLSFYPPSILCTSEIEGLFLLLGKGFSINRIMNNYINMEFNNRHLFDDYLRKEFLFSVDNQTHIFNSEYDSYLNQFIQPDTIIPDPGNSADWNRYAYVNYNPIKYIDVTGHEKVIIIYGTNYSEETNAFYAAAQTAYQNALDAGYKEEEILMVDVATDQDFFDAIAGNDPGEIEQVQFFGHGFAEAGSTLSYLYMSQATDDFEDSPESDSAVLSGSDFNNLWGELAGLFAEDSSITLYACLVGTGEFPQMMANTFNTTVNAYENNLHFYQFHQTTIHTSTSGEMPISFPWRYNGSGNYSPGSYVEMIPVWGGGIPFPYFFRQPKEFVPE